MQAERLAGSFCCGSHVSLVHVRSRDRTMAGHIALLLTAIACGAAVVRADNATSVVLGQLRPDGIVVPFASCNSSKWSTVSTKYFDRHEDSRWFAFKADGRVDTLRGGEWLETISDPDGDGGTFHGQMTDYDSRDSSGLGRPTVGVVVSEYRSGVPFEIVNEGSDTWRRLMKHLAPEFDRLEAEQVARSGARDAGADVLWWGHPLADEARSSFPAKAQITRVAVDDDAVLFHATVSREYPPPPRDEGCPGNTVFNAWLLERSARVSVIDSQLVIDNCDQKSVDVETPLIALFLEGRTFVVVDDVGYEWGAYQVLEWKNGGLRRVHEYAYHCL